MPNLKSLLAVKFFNGKLPESYLNLLTDITSPDAFCHVITDGQLTNP